MENDRVEIHGARNGYGHSAWFISADKAKEHFDKYNDWSLMNTGNPMSLVTGHLPMADGMIRVSSAETQGEYHDYSDVRKHLVHLGGITVTLPNTGTKTQDYYMVPGGTNQDEIRHLFEKMKDQSKQQEERAWSTPHSWST